MFENENKAYILSSDGNKFTLSRRHRLAVSGGEEEGKWSCLVWWERRAVKMQWGGMESLVVKHEAWESTIQSGEQKACGFMKGLELKTRGGNSEHYGELVEVFCQIDTKVRGARSAFWEKVLWGISWVCIVEKEAEYGRTLVEQSVCEEKQRVALGKRILVSGISVETYLSVYK